ncbi:tRNA (N(6)-L-threonylcarbamoyladenosine(37)-C(2))-methylthiotransferase MtaB [Sphingomonas flavalba]|uniref:tRNA (N(6)-L-threonylcarbamoyladenosine(37)-C(2))- methylthiotransferase MtaB n=1 Tax=Sphingomonas flavalba TaxID=2559804 RepID=UPI0039E1C2F8
MSVETITLGCRLNIAESAAMRAVAADAGDLVIINSCAVTQEAVRQTRKAIRRARRDHPAARLFVTGCAAELDPQSFAAMPEVSRVLGLADKFRRDSYTSEPLPAPFAPTVPADSDHARAFVAVQNGCDHRCTFCIIPHARGPARSLPAGAVIDTIRELVASGRREVVLTGVDLTSYGADLPGQPTLGALVARILKLVPELPRLRLSSLDPVEIDPLLLDLITGEPRLMPHLHLSLQAGDDMILKRMKRRHARADAVALVARVKAARPEVAIGADIIAGFPTETEAMFANSLALVADCAIVFGHIFPYSPRAGTPAARMPQVAPEVARARAARLRAACDAQRAVWLDELAGTTQAVLVERDGMTGHAGNFARLRLDRPALPGTVVAVTVDGRDGDTLLVREAA